MSNPEDGHPVWEMIGDAFFFKISNRGLDRRDHLKNFPKIVMCILRSGYYVSDEKKAILEQHISGKFARERASPRDIAIIAVELSRRGLLSIVCFEGLLSASQFIKRSRTSGDIVSIVTMLSATRYYSTDCPSFLELLRVFTNNDNLNTTDQHSCESVFRTLLSRSVPFNNYLLIKVFNRFTLFAKTSSCMQEYFMLLRSVTNPTLVLHAANTLCQPDSFDAVLQPQNSALLLYSCCRLTVNHPAIDKLCAATSKLPPSHFEDLVRIPVLVKGLSTLRVVHRGLFTLLSKVTR